MSKLPCRVSIIEDQKEHRDYLISIINEHEELALIASYTNAEDAILFIPKQKVDLVILDIGLPGKSGIDCLKLLHPQLPNTQFMMYTIFIEDDKVFESLKYGASGYMLKTDNEDRIIQAIKELHDGGSPMSPLIARKVVTYFSRPNQPQLLNQLSKRENEILSLVANGQLYKEIAASLDLSIGTIKQHLHRIYQKLHVQNRTEATNLFFGRQ